MSAALATVTNIPEERSVSTQSMVFDPTVIAGMQRMAEMMCEARVTIPKHLQGSPADCLAIIMQAAQFQINPFAMAQKTFLVGGVLGYEAQLVNAVIANSGAIRGRFHYEYRGDGQNIECRVGAIPAGETAVVWGEWLSAASVTTKNSPLWKTNPKQQLGYLQVKNWARQYTPGAILGVYTVDELQDAPERTMGNAEVIPSQPTASRTEAVKARLAARSHIPVSGVATPEYSGVRIQQDTAPDLATTLRIIADATTRTEMEQAAEIAKQLPSQTDKATARKAFKERAAQLKAEDDAEAAAEREAIQAEGEMTTAEWQASLGEVTNG